MKSILNSLDLIPETSNLDGLLLSTSPPKPFKTKTVTSAKELQVKVFEPEPNTEKKVISLPRLCPLKWLRVTKRLDLPTRFSMSHVGRHGEIWSDDSGQVAIVRRKTSHVYFFGSGSYEKINSYLTEAVNRGLTLVQSTDIVCHELAK
jgi:hypothetical protein